MWGCIVFSYIKFHDVRFLYPVDIKEKRKPLVKGLSDFRRGEFQDRKSFHRWCAVVAVLAIDCLPVNPFGMGDFFDHVVTVNAGPHFMVFYGE